MSDRGERLLDRDGWPLLYRTAYTRTIGARLRRMREAQRLTQNEERHRVERPRGGPYSQSMLSRLEAGYANAPLYVYIHFAEAYDVDAGTLLGPEETEKPASGAEMTLVRLLRRLGISADEAIARVISAQEGEVDGSG